MSRILLVDDDDAMREILQTMLGHMGHEVVTAANGRQALVRQEERPSELMLTDLFMPDMDGLETIRQIREQYPRVKIIAMSGGPARGGPKANYLELARKFGALYVLSKPFTVEELTIAIQAAALKAPPDSPA